MLTSMMERSQVKGFKPRKRRRKLKSRVYRREALKQKSVKRVGSNAAATGTWMDRYTEREQLQRTEKSRNLMFIGPCIIAIVDEWKANLMTLAILFHLLCAQHVSDINMSIFRSLRLGWWITTSVVLFSVRCVLEFLLRLVFGGVRFAGFSLPTVVSAFTIL